MGKQRSRTLALVSIACVMLGGCMMSCVDPPYVPQHARPGSGAR